MKTYQLGNKVTCIVRTYMPTTVGNVTTTFRNEPYTILKDVAVSITFNEYEKNARGPFNNRQLNYTESMIDKVRITNVQLTNKVLMMLFNTTEEGVLKSHYENITTDDEGKFFLAGTMDTTIYQVYLYNSDEEMCKSVETLDVEHTETLQLEPNTTYLIVYQTLKEGALLFNSPNNTYYTLDFICVGNTDEVTAPSYIHIEMCGLRADKSLYFNKNLNAVDLTFNVIANKETDYIILD